MKKMKNAPVVVLNFSGAYDLEDFDDNSDIINLDFRHVAGTAGYCSADAAKEIRERISGYGPRGIHFLDSGDYHYVSKFWTDMIRTPFSLVLIDHHTDMQDARADGMLSCGGWVKAAIEENPMLKHVFVLGVPKASAMNVDKALLSKVTFVTEQEFHDILDGIKEPASGETIYISIDKDVLSTKDAVTNWDQGDMREADLRRFLVHQVERENVIGVDVCGEYPIVSNLFANEVHAEMDSEANVGILLAIAKAKSIRQHGGEGGEIPQAALASLA